MHLTHCITLLSAAESKKRQSESVEHGVTSKDEKIARDLGEKSTDNNIRILFNLQMRIVDSKAENSRK